MRTKDKDTKSAHLRELEEVFDRRARRFSPFSVLGLSKESGEDAVEENEAEQNKSRIGPSPGVGLPTPPRGGSDPPISGYIPPVPGVGRPTPGTGRPTIVVEEENTTTKRPSPGVGLPTPPRGGSDPPTVEKDTFSAAWPIVNQTFDVSKQKGSKPPGIEAVHRSASVLPLPEIVLATQIGAQLGQKAKAVLGYLNSIRSLESDSYTVPVGYSQISSAAQIDGDYLRRKVLPKLAMLGLLGVARKGLNGTIYHLPYPAGYISTVVSAGAGEDHTQALRNVSLTNPAETTDSDLRSSVSFVDYPGWLDKVFWGWLSPENLQRLIDRAGSEAKAKEKLEIILYNENHGSPETRVRNRRSVLAHYLSSPNADIWPNDAGFETLEMKQLRQERERAKEEKTLAEQALRERQEATKAQFLSSLNDAQLRWLKQEAKRKVDSRPEAKFVTSRYPLYKAEEEGLTCEWIDRVAYGESVPEANIDLPPNSERFQ